MFDFTESMKRLIGHIALYSSELAYVQPDRVLVGSRHARREGAYGVFASCQPLRFKDGASTTLHRGHTYSMPKVMHEGVEMLYIIHFTLPRFMDLDFDTKLLTVFHELYHISPDFNGDIRRFPGKKYAHGYSRKKYNEHIKTLVESYTTACGIPPEAEFLRYTAKELLERYGKIGGKRIRYPKPKRL